MTNVNTIIEVTYENYTENVIVTEDNLTQVRSLIKNLVWSYVVEGSVIVEKVQKGLIIEFNKVYERIMNIQNDINMNIGFAWSGERGEWLNDRLEKANNKLNEIDNLMNKATHKELEEC